MRTYCTECDLECGVIREEFPEPYEYMGATGVHVFILESSDCCNSVFKYEHELEADDD